MAPKAEISVQRSWGHRSQFITSKNLSTLKMDNLMEVVSSLSLQVFKQS
jgi:hypothetical protein